MTETTGQSYYIYGQRMNGLKLAASYDTTCLASVSSVSLTVSVFSSVTMLAEGPKINTGN